METSRASFNGSKHLLQIFLFFLLSASGYPQYIDIIPNYGSPETYFKIDNLWNINLSKQFTDNNYYFLSLRLYNDNHQLLAKSKTKSFQISTPLFNILTNLNVTGTFETEWTDPGFFRIIQKTGGFLPAGNYFIEYTLLATTPGCNWAGEVLLKKNFPLQIESFHQIELLYPPNNDTIHTSFPVLMWLPIAPFSDDIHYTLKLAECTQNPMQDIFLNQPYLEIQNLKTNQIIYPASARKLEQGKKYVWQVIAMNSQQQIMATSTPFVFFTNKPKKKQTITLNPLFSYIELNDDLNNQWFFVSSDTLFLSLYEPNNPEASHSQLAIELSPLQPDQKNEIVSPPILPTRNIKNGMNFFYITLQNIKNGQYLMSICLNPKNSNQSKGNKPCRTIYITIKK